MAPRTLIEFFDGLDAGDGQYLVYDDGYRTWSYSYAETAAAARAFAARLRDSGIAKGQSIVVWSENRAEWIFALWGCVLEGVVLVPVDFRASADFVERVAAVVEARAALVGDTVDASALAADRPLWPISELRTAGASAPLVARAAGDAPSPDDTAEIIFTSGATAEPKGVIITHRNILANVNPIAREIEKYRRYARPFRPIRFLNLLPLSHMFGQAMAAFIPPLIPGVVVFSRGYTPEEIVRQIHDRRVSVLVCVPKVLEVLRDHVLRTEPGASTDPGPMHWVRRWWRYRRAHRMFGFKFWAFVVGAAPLDPDLEAFWGRLGFVVIQGYGLTETAPIVTLNHPLRRVRGAVGQAIPGVELRIAADGEVLVRGDNVTRGYYNAPEATRAAFEDGWFHTGDIGELDATGQLHIRGRKKELIVTPEGLNVFPDDVERVLNGLPGVRDSAVVGAPFGGTSAERVHAVVVADAGLDLDGLVRQANEQLADHQRIRIALLWPGDALPRTEGTRKLKRRELREWVLERTGAMPAARAPRTEGSAVDRLHAVLQRFAPGRAMSPTTTVGDLGLSSLERVELMMAMEDAFQITMDETAFGAETTVGDLETLVKPAPIGPGAAPRTAGRESQRSTEPIAFPTWNRSRAARAIRRINLPAWILPGAARLMTLDVSGLDHLRDIREPVIFAANHQSHLDTPAILRALPPRWRYRLAPAMAKEYFDAHFFPGRFPRRARLLNSVNYYLAALFFNGFPLPQRQSGTRQTLRYIGDIIAGGDSLLIFPEGRRTDTGEIGRFQPGVGMIAARLGVPVVPVRLEGLDRILHHGTSRPSPGIARVTFGRPMLLKGNDYSDLAAQVERAVREL